MLHVLGNKFSSSEVKKMIKLADINGDGKIDYHEFTQLMIGNKKAPSY
jgi:Ca2+-binding EF-hand superfamily protein